MAGMHTDRSGKQVVGKKRKTRGNATLTRAVRVIETTKERIKTQ